MVRRERLVQLRTPRGGSPIADSHIERLGRLRVLVGGGSMYLCIPLFGALRGGVVAIDRIVAPLLGIKVTPVGNYIVMDRHAIEGLSWLDKFNCDYCSYANGMNMLLHARMDELASEQPPVSRWRRMLARATSAATFAALAPWQWTFVDFLYGVLISRPLGMHRLSRAEADKRVERADYAAEQPNGMRRGLRRQKRFALQLEGALEQIESAWCPLKHLKQSSEMKYPDHHRNFFEPHQIEAMRCTLRTVGTVSDKKPRV
jgi:hypothetical protein